MLSVADKEKSVGFLGLVGVGVAAYAFNRGWRKLGGAGVAASLVVIGHCYNTYAYRKPLYDFRAEKGLEGKVLNLGFLPKELSVEAFGDRKSGWLADNAR